MNMTRIKPIGNKVFIEATMETTSTGGIIIPFYAMSRFPQSGRIVSIGTRCKEDLNIGDLVIVLDEGVDVGHSYSKAIALELKDWSDIEYCDIEIWPILHEAVQSSRATGEDVTIKLITIESIHLSMLASDILSYSLVDLSNPTLKLNYVNAVAIQFARDGIDRLFYFIPETEILATLEIPNV